MLASDRTEASFRVLEREASARSIQIDVGILFRTIAAYSFRRSKSGEEESSTGEEEL